MEVLKNNLKSNLNIRTENNYPTEGVEFVDITPLIMDKDNLKEIMDLFYNEIKDKEIDYIVAPEARGFLFGSALADRLNVGLIPIRKKGKLPPTSVEVTFSYEKEYGKDYLEIPKLLNDTYKGKKIYIVDDIYATGNTMKSIKNELINLGSTIVGEGVFLNIKELNDNKDLFSIIDINES